MLAITAESPLWLVQSEFGEIEIDLSKRRFKWLTAYTPRFETNEGHSDADSEESDDQDVLSSKQTEHADPSQWQAEKALSKKRKQKHRSQQPDEQQQPAPEQPALRRSKRIPATAASKLSAQEPQHVDLSLIHI